MWVPVDDVRGSRLVSLPFSDRADPAAHSMSTWKELSTDVLAAGVPYTLRCFDDAGPVEDPRLSTVGTAAWHGTALTATLDELHRGMISSTARRNIAAAHRRRVRIEAHTGIEGIRSFHELHVQLRKQKYGLLAPPVEFFERIWHAFAPDDAVVTLLAHVDDTLIAGAVYLAYNGVLYYKFGASLGEYLSLRPNDALFWAGITWGVERELSLLDWGLSDLDQPGLLAYKRKWATTERRIVTLRPAGSGAPGEPEVDDMLGSFTRLLTVPSVPNHLTREAGALLYRYFC